MAHPKSLHLDLIDLRLFLHVSQTLSLTRASGLSCISVAAASMRIKKLEEAVGSQLLYRDKRGMSLTPAGKVLAQHSQEFQRQMEKLRGDLQEYSSGNKGHIRVFANMTSMTEFMPAALARFFASHPPITVDLQEHLSGEIVRAVHDGIADIGIVAGNVRTDGLETLPYRRDQLVLATPKTHPLAKRHKIEFAESLDYDFVSLNDRSAIHSLLNSVVQASGKTMLVRIQAGSFYTMCRMIEANVGVGIMPKSAAKTLVKFSDIRIVDLSDQWALSQLEICVKKLDALPIFARQLVEIILSSSASAY
jgi:DNA-binding transcriptional LysR family regulator